MKNKNSIYKIVTVGLLGALVFVSNYLSFPIPVPVGDISRIHLGNAFCLLAGSAPEAAAIALATKAASSTVNAILAIIISVPLSALIRKALKSAHLTTK